MPSAVAARDHEWVVPRGARTRSQSRLPFKKRLKRERRIWRPSMLREQYDQTVSGVSRNTQERGTTGDGFHTRWAYVQSQLDPDGMLVDEIVGELVDGVVDASGEEAVVGDTGDPPGAAGDPTGDASSAAVSPVASASTAVNTHLPSPDTIEAVLFLKHLSAEYRLVDDKNAPNPKYINRLSDDELLEINEKFLRNYPTSDRIRSALQEINELHLKGGPQAMEEGQGSNLSTPLNDPNNWPVLASPATNLQNAFNTAAGSPTNNAPPATPGGTNRSSPASYVNALKSPPAASPNIPQPSPTPSPQPRRPNTRSQTGKLPQKKQQKPWGY